MYLKLDLPDWQSKVEKISNLKLMKYQKWYSTQIVSMHVFRTQLSCSASFSV